MFDLSPADVGQILWPFGEEGNWLVQGFVVFIWGFGLGALAYLAWKALPARKDIGIASQLLHDVDRQNLLQLRSTLRQRAHTLRESSRARSQWLEFDETLVEVNGALRNTALAEEYFGAERFAPRVIENRMLHTVPSILTALGLLGTFVGLAVGLNNLEFSADASVEEIRGGLGPMILGAAVGFSSSVWGIAMSVAVNVALRATDSHLTRLANEFVQHVDELFVHQSSEQSLVEIEKHSESSTAALNELHEKIGTRLQESIQGLSSEMQDAVSRAISASIRPAMDQIAQHSITQTTEVFSQLVDKFAGSFASIGDRQAEQLGQASEALRSSMSEMSTAVSHSVSEVMRAIDKQHAEAAAQADALRAQLAELSELTQSLALRVDAAAERMESGATALGAAGESLEAGAVALAGTREKLEGTLEAVAQALDGTADAHAQAAELLQSHTSELVRLHDSSRALSTSVTEAASHVNDGFRGLGQQQEQFLEGLEHRIGRLDRSMDAHLEDYDEKVRQQIGERMEEWNRHSRDYASHMLRTSESLLAVMDELEVRTDGAATSA